MRRIYLVRHGKPDFPNDGHYCIGRTDIPLNTLGHLQGVLLGEWFRGKNISKVFCSCLTRSKETAEYIADAEVLPGIEEHFAGEWDGLCFDEIRLRWSELYEKRGADPTVLLPGAESIADCMARFAAAVYDAIKNSEGDIVLVSHATVIQTYLCGILGRDIKGYKKVTLPYGSVTTLIYDGEGLYAESVGIPPQVDITFELCSALMNAAGNEDKIIAHCRAVAHEALCLAERLNRHGFTLDLNMIEHAALLHDIARRKKNHAELGAKWLSELGFSDVADIVRQHEDMDFDGINEAAVVNIADKCISETGKVSIDERFTRSAAKCVSDEAKAAHARKDETAKRIKAAVNAACEEDIIK